MLHGEHLSAAPEAAIRPAPFEPVKGALVTPIGRPDSVEALAVVGERAPVAGQAARDRRGQLQGPLSALNNPCDDSGSKQHAASPTAAQSSPTAVEEQPLHAATRASNGGDGGSSSSGN